MTIALILTAAWGIASTAFVIGYALAVGHLRDARLLDEAKILRHAGMAVPTAEQRARLRVRSAA